MEDITQKLQDLAFGFDTLHELNISSFDALAEELEEFNEEYEDQYTDDQQDLYEVAFALMEMADEHFEPERLEEEAEERRDQRSYLGSEGNH